jgi:hypothetical protein
VKNCGRVGYIQMMNAKKAGIEKEYATVDDDGVNYRDISMTMTELGYKMNHSSARNYIIRVMKKFALAYSQHMNQKLDDEQLEGVVKSPEFQSTMADILSALETNRREEERKKRTA